MSSGDPWSTVSGLVTPPWCDEGCGKETAWGDNTGEVALPFDGSLDCEGLADAPKLEPRACNGLGPDADAEVAIHGTLCFWHSAQLALLDSLWHRLRLDLHGS